MSNDELVESIQGGLIRAMEQLNRLGKGEITVSGIALLRLNIQAADCASLELELRARNYAYAIAQQVQKPTDQCK